MSSDSEKRKARKALLEKSLTQYVYSDIADGEEAKLRKLLEQREELMLASQKAVWSPDPDGKEDEGVPGSAAILPPSFTEEALQARRESAQEALCTLHKPVPVGIEADAMVKRVRRAGRALSGEELHGVVESHCAEELASLKVAQWRCKQALARHAAIAEGLTEAERAACTRRGEIIDAAVLDNASRLARLRALAPPPTPEDTSPAQDRDRDRGDKDIPPPDDYDVKEAVNESDLVAMTRHLVHRSGGERQARWLVSRLRLLPYTQRQQICVAAHRLIQEPAPQLGEGGGAGGGLAASGSTSALAGTGPSAEASLLTSDASESATPTGWAGGVPMMVMDDPVLDTQLRDLLAAFHVDEFPNADNQGHQALFHVRSMVYTGLFDEQTKLRTAVSAPWIERRPSGPDGMPVPKPARGSGDGPAGLSSLVAGGLDFEDPAAAGGGREMQMGISGHQPPPGMDKSVQILRPDMPMAAERLRPSVGGHGAAGAAHGAMIREVRYIDKLLVDENGFLDEPKLEVAMARVQQLARDHEGRALHGRAGDSEEVRARFQPSSGREWGEETFSAAAPGAGGGEDGDVERTTSEPAGSGTPEGEGRDDEERLPPAKLEAVYTLRMVRSRANKLRCLHAANVSASLRVALAVDEEAEAAAERGGGVPEEISAAAARLDTYTEHADLGVRVVGHEGFPVLYRRAEEEMAALEEEVVAMGSHCLEGERRRLAEGVKPSGVDMWKAVDRLAILADLWELEARFATAKQGLLSAYRQVYERISSPAKRAALRKEMVEVMFRRPGMDPAADYFSPRHASEIASVEVEARLIREVAEGLARGERRRGPQLQSAVAAASISGTEYPPGLPAPLLGAVSARLEGLDLLPCLESVAEVPAALREVEEAMWGHAQMRGDAARRTLRRVIVTQALKEWRALEDEETQRGRIVPSGEANTKDVIGMEPETRNWLAESPFLDNAVAMDAAIDEAMETDVSAPPEASSPPRETGRRASWASGVEDTKRGHEDKWAVAAAGARIAMLRPELLEALYECEVLHGAHSMLARALGKELVATELEPIDFDGKVARPTRLEDVEESSQAVSPGVGDGGPPLRLPPLAVSEFSADMAEMEFQSAAGARALLRPGGLQLLSQAVLAQVVQREALLTAVRHNQVLTDAVARSLMVEEDNLRRESAAVTGEASVTSVTSEGGQINPEESALDDDVGLSVPSFSTPPVHSLELGQGLPRLSQQELFKMRGKLVADASKAFLSLFSLKYSLRAQPLEELTARAGSQIGRAAKGAGPRQSKEEIKGDLLREYASALAARLRPAAARTQLAETTAALARAHMGPLMAAVEALGSGMIKLRPGDFGPFIDGEGELRRVILDYGDIHDVRAVTIFFETTALTMSDDAKAERDKSVALAAHRATAVLADGVTPTGDVGAGLWSLPGPFRILQVKHGAEQIDQTIRIFHTIAGLADARWAIESLAQAAGHVASGAVRAGRPVVDALNDFRAQASALADPRSSAKLLDFAMGRRDVLQLRHIMAITGARDEFASLGSEQAWHWTGAVAAAAWEKLFADDAAGCSRGISLGLTPPSASSLLMLRDSDRQLVMLRGARLDAAFERLAESINAMPSVEPELCHDRDSYYLRLMAVHARLKEAVLQGRVAGLKERADCGKLPLPAMAEAVLTLLFKMRQRLPDISVGTEGTSLGFAMSSPGRTNTIAIELRALEATTYRLKQMLDEQMLEEAVAAIQAEVVRLASGSRYQDLYHPDLDLSAAVAPGPGGAPAPPDREGQFRKGSIKSLRPKAAGARGVGGHGGRLPRRRPEDLMADVEVAEVVSKYMRRMRAQRLVERPRDDAPADDGDLTWGGVGDMVYEVNEGEVKTWTCEVVGAVLAHSERARAREAAARESLEQSMARRQEALQLQLMDAREELAETRRAHILRREAEVCTRGMELIIELEHCKRQVDRSGEELQRAKEEMRGEIRVEFQDELARLHKEIFTLTKNKEEFQSALKTSMLDALDEVKKEAALKAKARTEHLRDPASNDKQNRINDLEAELSEAHADIGKMERAIIKLQTLYKLRGMARDLNLDKRWQALVIDTRNKTREGWAAREEVERRCRSLEMQLTLTQTSLATAEERLRGLDRELEHSNRNKQRLVKWKVEHQSEVSELRGKVDSLERVKGIDVHTLLSNLSRAEGELDSYKEKEKRAIAERRVRDFKPMEREVERLRDLLAQERSVKESLMERLNGPGYAGGGSTLSGIKGDLWERKYSGLRGHVEVLLAQNHAMRRAMHGFEMLEQFGDPVEIPEALLDPASSRGSPSPTKEGVPFSSVDHLAALAAVGGGAGAGAGARRRPQSALPRSKAAAPGVRVTTPAKVAVFGSTYGGGPGRPQSAPAVPRQQLATKPGRFTTPQVSQMPGAAGTFVVPAVPPLLTQGLGLSAPPPAAVASSRTSSSGGARSRPISASHWGSRYTMESNSRR